MYLKDNRIALEDISQLVVGCEIQTIQLKSVDQNVVASGQWHTKR